MNLYLIPILLLLSTAVSAADVVANKPHSLQDGHLLQVDYLPEGEQRLNVHYRILDDVSIFPGKTQPSGSLQALAASYEYGLLAGIAIGGQLAIASETIRGSDRYFINKPSFDSGLSIFARYSLVQTPSFGLNLLPFVELGLADKRHFSYSSKSKIGLTFAANYKMSLVTILGNVQYRYRPSEIHDHFRMASDWGGGVELRHQLSSNWQLWVDGSLQFAKALNVNRGANRYTDISSSQLGLGTTYQADSAKYFAGYRAPVGVRELGIAQHQIVLGSGWSFPVKTQDSQRDQQREERLRLLDEMRRELSERSLKSPKMVDQASAAAVTPVQNKQQATEPSSDDADQEIADIQENEKSIKASKTGNVFDATREPKSAEGLLQLPEPSAKPSH